MWFTVLKMHCSFCLVEDSLSVVYLEYVSQKCSIYYASVCWCYQHIRILYLPFYSVPLFYITRSISNNIKCMVQLYSRLLSKFYNLWLILTCTVYRNSSGLVLQVVFLKKYVLESKQFSFWPFQFSVSVFHFHCFQLPIVKVWSSQLGRNPKNKPWCYWQLSAALAKGDHTTKVSTNKRLK